MDLYGYYRSSAAFRVRIALAFKGLDYNNIPINIIPEVSEQKSEAYKAINPQSRVPFFKDDAVAIGQSPAILEYLEEHYPDPPLLPSSIAEKAEVRQVCALIGCDIHPLNNLAVLSYLKNTLDQDQAAINQWYAHWIIEGFTALEEMVNRQGDHQKVVYGKSVTMADVYLVPQVFNAKRYNVDLSPFPTIERIYTHLITLPAFGQSLPENQPDAV